MSNIIKSICIGVLVMNTIDRDINNTGIAIKSGPGYWVKDNGDLYSKIYFSTNEPVQEIIKYFDLKDKNILTVIGSGDQAFAFCKHSPKKVDLFDMNKLAVYYFYLRLWAIKYLDSLYPVFIFEKSGIKNLLSCVDATSEEEICAYNFWMKYSDVYTPRDTWNLMLSGVFDTKALNDNDILDIKQKLSSINNIYNIDISKDINMHNKYDIIYVSNISDFIDNINSMKIYRDNLSHLLKDDGFVLCSNVTRIGESRLQRCVFEEKFMLHSLPVEYIKLAGVEYSLGYYYTKHN